MRFRFPDLHPGPTGEGNLRQGPDVHGCHAVDFELPMMFEFLLLRLSLHRGTRHGGERGDQDNDQPDGRRPALPHTSTPTCFRLEAQRAPCLGRSPFLPPSPEEFPVKVYGIDAHDGIQGTPLDRWGDFPQYNGEYPLVTWVYAGVVGDL